MSSVLDPATLFNSAVLQLHVPPRPHSGSPPSPTFRGAQSAQAIGKYAQSERETDAWVQQLVNEGEREVGYYDEHLPFYLLLRLPASAASPPLNRAQAMALLLPLAPLPAAGVQPHLQLTADISYVEGSPAAHVPPNHQVQSSSSASALGYGFPNSAALRKGSLPSLPPPSPDLSRPLPPSAGPKPRLPLTPSPLPATRKEDGFIADTSGVSVWTGIFSSLVTERGAEETKESDEVKRIGGRQWLGQVGDEWVGVWEFSGEMPYLQTAFHTPRLCVTVTATFRDDNHLAQLLLLASSDIAKDGSPVMEDGADNDEDDWLVESPEDVNLLSSLSSVTSTALRLPASRLAQPFTAADAAPQRPRKSSRASLSGPLPPLPTADGRQLQPRLRRSVRRVLDVKAAVAVRMRSVPCSSVPGSRMQHEAGAGMGTEGQGETEGLLMCVEVEGVGADGNGQGDDDLGFEIVSVDIEVTPSPSHFSSSTTWMGTSDIQIKSLSSHAHNSSDQSDIFPIILGPREQHNFLYSVSFSSEAAAARLAGQGYGLATNEGLGSRWPGESVPREVATSPSQRFTARFGDHPADAPKLERAADQRAGDDQWLRGVAIVVRGRPVTSAEVGAARPRGGNRSSQDSEVDSPAGMTGRGLSRDFDSPTTPFSSRWNCTLDISAFAQRSPPQIAAFNYPLPIRPPCLPSSAAQLWQAKSSLSSTASKRNSKPDLPPIQAIAGSKRHTMASLASLASTSPLIQQRSSRRAEVVTHQQQDGRQSLSIDTRSRASTEFLMPLQAPAIEAQTPGATGPSRRFFSLPPDTGIPSELQPLQPGSNRSSSPLPPPTTPAYPPHFSARSTIPFVDPLGRRAIEGGSRGFELDGKSRNDQAVARRMGSVIVSVSLIPLRLVKSQRPPKLNTTIADGDSSPEVERARHSGRLSPHATFQFPSPTSSPDPSARASPEPSPAVPASPSPFPSMERRQSCSVYPAPSAAPLVKEPRPRAPRIGLLDVFLVEVFIVNRGEEVKRFTVGVPVRKAEEKGSTGRGAAMAPGTSRPGEGKEDRVAKIVALENDVRIGPLAPNTCASVRLRFLAIRPGAHTLEELRLVDLGTGLETRLRNPLSVVVE